MTENQNNVQNQEKDEFLKKDLIRLKSYIRKKKIKNHLK